MNVSHLFFHVVFFFFLFVHLQARRPQKQLKAHSAHPQNVHGTQVPSTSSRCHQPCSAWPTFRAHPNLPVPNLFSSLSSELGERGDARETATDRREGGRRRGGPRDAQAEEPPALLSLPNQTRAGAAGTGLLPLWSVLTRRSCDAIAPTVTSPRNKMSCSVVQHLMIHPMQKSSCFYFSLQRSKGILFIYKYIRINK